MKTKIALLLAIVLLAACSPAILRLGTLVLKPGQSATSADGSVSVTFVELIQDSRCPADAMCIWQGNVRVLIEVRQGTEMQRYTLTLGALLEGDVSSISLPGYTITLKDVQPYPLTSQPSSPADYEITLGISY